MSALERRLAAGELAAAHARLKLAEGAGISLDEWRTIWLADMLHDEARLADRQAAAELLDESMKTGDLPRAFRRAMAKATAAALAKRFRVPFTTAWKAMTKGVAPRVVALAAAVPIESRARAFTAAVNALTRPTVFVPRAPEIEDR